MGEADNISSPLERPGRGHLACDIQWDIQKFKYSQNPFDGHSFSDGGLSTNTHMKNHNQNYPDSYRDKKKLRDICPTICTWNLELEHWNLEFNRSPDQRLTVCIQPYKDEDEDTERHQRRAAIA